SVMFKAIGLLAALTALAFAVACGGPGGTAQSSASPTLDASLTPKPSPIASPAANTGTIAGHVTTPSEVIVAQLVYAISIDNPDRAFSTETIFGQSAYSIRGVEPGAYHVHATKRPVEPRSDGQVTGALYSAAVPCGLNVSCKDNSPLKVTVTANAITNGVDPIDWYTETALIPAPPPAIVRSHSTVPAGGRA